MTRNETKTVLAVLRVAYPGFYKGLTDDETTATINLWAEMFQDEPAPVVGAAVKAMVAIRTSNFPPCIGEIKEQIAKMQTTGELTEGEAWGLVMKAIRNSLYNAPQEYEKLPAEIQRAVGSATQLREWAAMDTDTLSSVVASNFQRAYRVRAASNREYSKLPGDIKRMIAATADRMALDSGKEENV